MKQFIKIFLICAAIIGSITLVVTHFMYMGTSEGEIAKYDFQSNFHQDIDSLSTNWSNGNLSRLNELYAQLEIVRAMGAVDSDIINECTGIVDTKANSILNGFFKQNVWPLDDMQKVSNLAQYNKHESSINAINGYNAIKNLVNRSNLCRTQKQTEDCVEEAKKYSVSPWTNCTELNTDLHAVPNNAFSSFTTKTLIPKCNKMNTFRTSYEYFDDFDKDYQIVKNAKAYLTRNNYSNNNLNTKFNAIKYNDAANVLDPKFF